MGGGYERSGKDEVGYAKILEKTTLLSEVGKHMASNLGMENAVRGFFENTDIRGEIVRKLIKHGGS